MVFTVITPALNCAALLERNFNSVRIQGFGTQDLEQWVIDAGSKDGTVEVLKRYPEVRWVSEPDRGLSHAVNKGIEKAKGDWICWLNADDELTPGALRSFLDFRHRHEDARLFVGDQAYMGYNGDIKTVVSGRAYTFENLTCDRFDINQPAMVVHRDVYANVGAMDEAFRYAMDYEWAVRAVRKYRYVHIPRVMASCHMRKGSITDVNKAGAMREIARVRRRYGLSRFSRADALITFYICTEPLRKIRLVREAVRRLKMGLGVNVALDGG